MIPKAPPCRLHAGCKINLGLHITGVRADGYHELDSLFYPLPEPHDTLHIRENAVPGLTLECSRTDIDPRRNTVTRAYAAFSAATDFSPALQVVLEKGIPQGAGLGGGSADAGALLRALNAWAPVPLREAELVNVAAAVGADVPFFLYNRPCRVRGIGERMTPCEPDLSGLHLLLLCPDVHISTPWAYAAW
ncbi:MAG: 4-(cytidine 5'-diphospho)-2-C-methyl-D-erythritol kinase, partial [Desulfovibrionaceae bacterium]|nr:4-(cytidine 5'-diphospho)-2-C-methyl-D-erythritol kinase [Desulfovibrionaceae bacterium]